MVSLTHCGMAKFRVYAARQTRTNSLWATRRASQYLPESGAKLSTAALVTHISDPFFRPSSRLTTETRAETVQIGLGFGIDRLRRCQEFYLHFDGSLEMMFLVSRRLHVYSSPRDGRPPTP